MNLGDDFKSRRVCELQLHIFKSRLCELTPRLEDVDKINVVCRFLCFQSTAKSTSGFVRGCLCARFVRTLCRLFAETRISTQRSHFRIRDV